MQPYILLFALITQLLLYAQGPLGPYPNAPAGPLVSAAYRLVSFNGTTDYLDEYYSADLINYWQPAPLATLDHHGRDFSIYNDAKSGNHYSGGCWIAYTGSVDQSSASAFYVAHGSNCLTFTSTTVSVCPAGCTRCWAPEFVKNQDGTAYYDTSIHVTFAADSTGHNLQIYEVHPTAADMSTWSIPVLIYAQANCSLGNCIDPFLLSYSGTFYLWYINWGGGFNNTYVEYATASSLTGTYTAVKTGDWAGWGVNSEGPALILDGSTWYLYLDQSGSSLTAGQINYTTSSSLNNGWTGLLPISTLGIQSKQGTMIPY